MGGLQQCALKVLGITCLEPPLEQMLVVVGNTQVRPLRTKVEKGSMLTAVEHGSVGPKELENSFGSFGDAVKCEPAVD